LVALRKYCRSELSSFVSMIDVEGNHAEIAHRQVLDLVLYRKFCQSNGRYVDLMISV
jgi:hypothetical protein